MALVRDGLCQAGWHPADDSQPDCTALKLSLNAEVSAQVIVPRRGSGLPSTGVQFIKHGDEFKQVDRKRGWYLIQARHAPGRLFVAEECDLPFPLGVSVNVTTGS